MHITGKWPSLNPNRLTMLFRDKAIIHLESVDSTNNYAASLIKLSRPPEGSVITAQEQTAGKGQRGALWTSEKGENLLFSIILYPPFQQAEDLFALSQCISLALADSLTELTGIDAWVKWPNDIVMRDKKVAGILVEFAWTDSRVQSAICGMGVNLNQTSFEWPHAASLRMLTGKTFHRDTVLGEVIQRIESGYLRLRSGQLGPIRKEYTERLYRLNTPTAFDHLGSRITASISGVSPSGQLQLRDDAGTLFSCDLREISLVYPP